MRSFLTMAVCLALSGCTTQSSSTGGQSLVPMSIDARIAPYVGRSIADVMIDHGPPTTSIDMGVDKRAFQWQYNGQTPGAVVPLSGTLIAVPPEQHITCLISYIATTNKPSPAMSDWIIESWHRTGC